MRLSTVRDEISFIVLDFLQLCHDTPKIRIICLAKSENERGVREAWEMLGGYTTGS